MTIVHITAYQVVKDIYFRSDLRFEIAEIIDQSSHGIAGDVVVDYCQKTFAIIDDFPSSVPLYIPVLRQTLIAVQIYFKPPVVGQIIADSFGGFIRTVYVICSVICNKNIVFFRAVAVRSYLTL